VAVGVRLVQPVELGQDDGLDGGEPLGRPVAEVRLSLTLSGGSGAAVTLRARRAGRRSMGGLVPEN
jgi:hypothetical protein